MKDSRDRAETTESSSTVIGELTGLGNEGDTGLRQSIGDDQTQMATSHLPDLPPRETLPDGSPLMTMDEAVAMLSRDERFMATIYALRSSLVEKGILSPDEIDYHFRQWAQKEQNKRQSTLAG